jgi:hypothetical protein
VGSDGKCSRGKEDAKNPEDGLIYNNIHIHIYIYIFVNIRHGILLMNRHHAEMRAWKKEENGEKKTGGHSQVSVEIHLDLAAQGTRDNEVVPRLGHDGLVAEEVLVAVELEEAVHEEARRAPARRVEEVAPAAESEIEKRSVSETAGIARGGLACKIQLVNLAGL